MASPSFLSSRPSPHPSPRAAPDLGARVIKIERPESVILRAPTTNRCTAVGYFVLAQRSKESLTLDVKHPQAQAILGGSWSARTSSSRISHPVPRRGWLAANTLLPQHPRCVVATSRAMAMPDLTPARKPTICWCRARRRAQRHRHRGCASKVGNRSPISAPPCMLFVRARRLVPARSATGKGTGIEVTMFEAMAEWIATLVLHALRRQGARRQRSRPRDHRAVRRFAPATGGGDVRYPEQREWASSAASCSSVPNSRRMHGYDNNTKRTAARERCGDSSKPWFAELTAEQPSQGR